MQLLRMVLIAFLAGLLGAGIVWLGWDMLYKLFNVVAEGRKKRRLKAESEALMEQAEEPAEEDRPD